MLGISRNTLKSRIKDEQQAQKDYGEDAAKAKRKKDTKSFKTLGHIRGEEREHETMLRKLGE